MIHNKAPARGTHARLHRSIACRRRGITGIQYSTAPARLPCVAGGAEIQRHMHFETALVRKRPLRRLSLCFRQVYRLRSKPPVSGRAGLPLMDGPLPKLARRRGENRRYTDRQVVQERSSTSPSKTSIPISGIFSICSKIRRTVSFSFPI